MQDVAASTVRRAMDAVNLPRRGPQNPTPVDHATDTYDTIEWLVKNVPESRTARSASWGSRTTDSCRDGARRPAPGAQGVVPMNPMVDGWMGDDWFQIIGAFRQSERR